MKNVPIPTGFRTIRPKKLSTIINLGLGLLCYTANENHAQSYSINGDWGFGHTYTGTLTINSATATAAGSFVGQFPASTQTISYGYSTLFQPPPVFPFPPGPPVLVTDSIQISITIPASAYTLSIPSQTPTWRGGTSWGVAGHVSGSINVQFSYSIYEDGVETTTGAGSYTISPVGGWAGTLDTLDYPTSIDFKPYVPRYEPTSNTPIIDYVGTRRRWTISPFGFTPVPESSHVALACGGLLLGWALVRRRIT